jgi:hypothetical protein
LEKNLISAFNTFEVPYTTSVFSLPAIEVMNGTNTSSIWNIRYYVSTIPLVSYQASDFIRAPVDNLLYRRRCIAVFIVFHAIICNILYIPSSTKLETNMDNP